MAFSQGSDGLKGGSTPSLRGHRAWVRGPSAEVYADARRSPFRMGLGSDGAGECGHGSRRLLHSLGAVSLPCGHTPIYPTFTWGCGAAPSGPGGTVPFPSLRVTLWSFCL